MRGLTTGHVNQKSKERYYVVVDNQLDNTSGKLLARRPIGKRSPLIPK